MKDWSANVCVRFWQRQRGAEETIHIGRVLIAEVCGFQFLLVEGV